MNKWKSKPMAQVTEINLTLIIYNILKILPLVLKIVKFLILLKLFFIIINALLTDGGFISKGKFKSK